MERSQNILCAEGSISMIVPLALVSTQRMNSILDILMKNQTTWFSNYAWRPGKLFDSVNRALTIFICRPSQSGNDAFCFATNYQKWNAEQRQLIFELLPYVPTEKIDYWIPKITHSIETEIIGKFQQQKKCAHFLQKTGENIFYRTTGGLYWKVFTTFAPYFKCNGQPGHSSRETSIAVDGKRNAENLSAILLSDFFWYWYTLSSNLRDLNPSDISNFYIPRNFVTEQLGELAIKLQKDIDNNSVPLIRNQKDVGITETQSFRIKQSKALIDKVDTVLAKLYSMTESELDFIISYDIKYRMGDEEN